MDEKVIKELRGTKITLNVEKGGSYGGREYKTMELGSIFDIDEANLAKELANQASIYAYFAAQTAKAEQIASQLEMATEEEYAKADMYYRQTLEGDGKKVTEGMVKQLVTADEEYGKIAESALEAKYDHKLLKAITTAMEQRANMLISLGAFLRHEMAMEGMHINERQMDSAVGTVKEIIRERRKSGRD